METYVPLAQPLFDVEKIRRDFPILSTCPHGKPLIYLDNAASSQKPQQVIDAIVRFYSGRYANIHRGVHALSQDASEDYDNARERIARFINAREASEVVFTRGCTEGINLVASCFGSDHVGKGDNIVVTALEHHANIVPWQILTEKQGAELRVAPIDDNGVLLEDQFAELLDERTRIVALGMMSNALGTINPLERLIPLAKQAGATVLIDAAQAAPHMAPDVQALGCDFLAFSGHKVYGPTGIGVLWGRKELLNAMPPYQFGGDMISRVSWEKTTFKDAPERFEAGTPHIEGAIGLAAAIDYLEGIGFDAIHAYEHELLEYGTGLLSEIPGLRIVGTAPRKGSILSFVMEGIHPHDIGTFLDEAGIAVRTGLHCTEPLMKRLDLPGTTRASLAFYNTREELDKLAAMLRKIQMFFA